eukprot:TRINITY_DN2058_c0_g1_i3.p1 TRINITY_DN2058_c0_g1~~TRINITY_DN2058_c0_g1_i3.p1  ORF type:complete len:369 (-),score=68.38 TRINITY_DN2058_c0_g1_i3:2108-3169(-)
MSLHTVPIQDLKPQPRDQSWFKSDAEQTVKPWVRIVDDDVRRGRAASTERLLYHEENMPATYPAHSSGFYQAFAKAYNDHAGIILSPDDVWQQIAQCLSSMVNSNAEGYRSVFVSHQGKKEVTVTTSNDISEKQWDEFFDLIGPAIDKIVNPGVVPALAADFSTTTRMQRTISTAVVMDTLKAYLDYGRCIPCCGITSASFLGTAEDWQHLVEKVAALAKFAPAKQPEAHLKFVRNMTATCNKFLDTYRGQVDVEWWNRVMNHTHGRIGSGSTTKVSGWILEFYGRDAATAIDVDDIPNFYLDVKIKIDNHLSGEKKDVKLVGGFQHLNKTVLPGGGEAFRPRTSLIIYHAKV